MTADAVQPAETGTAELDGLLDAAVAASRHRPRPSASQRATWLEAVAEALEAAGPSLLPVASQETAIAQARLRGELNRTSNQLRLFAQVCRDGGYLEAVLDSADPSLTPPRPDLRRMLAPLGPVAVFAAGNFPFAFSVAGGDTASALAAGCPVVVKAHPGHPRLSAATATVVADALRAAGAPAGMFALVHGTDTGTALVQDPRVKAVGFTGSLRGGRALFGLATSRPDPIPFYGELGSLNPVYVTADAAAARAEPIARGFVDSYTLGSGQLCTKPGLVVTPAGSGMAERAADLAAQVSPGSMLNESTVRTFAKRMDAWSSTPGVRFVVETDTGPQADQDGLARVLLAVTDVPTLLSHRGLSEEAFGPASLIVEYEGAEQLLALARSLPGTLTASIFAEGTEGELEELTSIALEQAGRVLWNGWPTGVAVAWSMHHGGPWPATTSPLHTSVGATAIRRWLRPITFQDWPQHLLPPELRDGAELPTRRDGVLH